MKARRSRTNGPEITRVLGLIIESFEREIPNDNYRVFVTREILTQRFYDMIKDRPDEWKPSIASVHSKIRLFYNTKLHIVDYQDKCHVYEIRKKQLYTIQGLLYTVQELKDQIARQARIITRQNSTLKEYNSLLSKLKHLIKQ